MESAADGQARRYPNVLNAIVETPWAILRSKWDEIRAIVQLRLDGVRLTDEEIRSKIGEDYESPQPYIVAARGAGARSAGGAVAVLPVYGVIMPRATVLSQFSGGTSLEVFQAQLRAAVDNPDVGSILLDIDSPGGSVSGVPEAAEAIREANGKKPVYAIANALAASAAYHLASQASEVIVTPSGVVGSIGVFTVHDDFSEALAKVGIKPTYVYAGKYKVEGNPDEPLTDEAKAAMQELVDDFYGLFVADVAKGRGVSKSDVRNGFGEGRVVTAGKAVKLGMADRVATFEATVSRLVRGGGAVSPRAEDQTVSIAIDPTYQGDASALAEKIRAELFGHTPAATEIDDEPEAAPVEVLLPGAERLLARSSFRESIKPIAKEV